MCCSLNSDKTIMTYLSDLSTKVFYKPVITRETLESPSETTKRPSSSLDNYYTLPSVYELFRYLHVSEGAGSAVSGVLRRASWCPGLVLRFGDFRVEVAFCGLRLGVGLGLLVRI